MRLGDLRNERVDKDGVFEESEVAFHHVLFLVDAERFLSVDDFASRAGNRNETSRLVSEFGYSPLINTDLNAQPIPHFFETAGAVLFRPPTMVLRTLLSRCP